jgi:hypothetical protein
MRSLKSWTTTRKNNQFVDGSGNFSEPPAQQQTKGVIITTYGNS